MSEQKKPRELFIDRELNAHFRKEVIPLCRGNEIIHVIEYSAFQAAQERIRELEAEKLELEKLCDNAQEHAYEFRKKYFALKSKADKLRDKLKSGSIFAIDGTIHQSVLDLIQAYDEVGK